MTVYISIDQRSDGQLQIGINKEDPDGGGHGYRIAGPKYDGSGKTLLKHKITKRDVDEIRSYLRAVASG